MRSSLRSHQPGEAGRGWNGSSSAPRGAASELIVVGAGIAGLAVALGAARDPRAPARSITLLTKTRFGVGVSRVWAQGGVAAAVGPGDSSGLHAADTLGVGCGLNEPEIVRLLTREGPTQIRRLVALGARFDRSAGGDLALGQEAGHTRRRVLHAGGDATGAEMVRALVEAVGTHPRIRVEEEVLASELVLEAGRVAGVAGFRGPYQEPVLYPAEAVVLATGGLGQLFLHTTNPKEATADGLVMAARAGARLADLEFVQFHPTALATGRDPMPLLTEALRGEGGLLVDDAGRRFLVGQHPAAELAPRDVVARAIWRQLAAGRTVFLDLRPIGAHLPERFPTVFEHCREAGLDPRKEPVPVAPAAHYHMGGIAVDAWGRSSVPGLWACGEVASTGAHGANRLASNSLLEGLVFGARVARDLTRISRTAWTGTGGLAPGDPGPGLGGLPGRCEPVSLPARQSPPTGMGLPQGLGSDVERAVRRLLWEKMGLERDAAGLSEARRELAVWNANLCARGAPDRVTPDRVTPDRVTPDRVTPDRVTPDRVAPDRVDRVAPDRVASDRILVAHLLVTAALLRRESRGSHFRTDYPTTRPEWRRRLYLAPIRETALSGSLRAPDENAPAGAPYDERDVPQPAVALPL